MSKRSLGSKSAIARGKELNKQNKQRHREKIAAKAKREQNDISSEQ